MCVDVDGEKCFLIVGLFVIEKKKEELRGNGMENCCFFGNLSDVEEN